MLDNYFPPAKRVRNQGAGEKATHAAAPGI
jgi:hypothetical protein